LATLGFTLRDGALPFTLNHLMCLFGVFGVLLLGGSVAFGAVGAEASAGVKVVRALMVAAFYSVAVACAVFPKERWHLARREPGQMRPVAFYVFAGLVAVVATQAAGFGFQCLLARGLEGGFVRYRLTYPWMLLTFATALTTGFLVDDVAVKRRARITQALEGLGGAAVLALSGLVAQAWLADTFAQATAQGLAIPTTYRVPSLASVVILSAAVGLIIGLLVPHWYRDAPRSRTERGSTAQPRLAVVDRTVVLPGRIG
jgi:hypothetical protein